MPPTTVVAGRRVLFAMAADAEYGPHLRRLFEPLMTGVGPIRASGQQVSERATDLPGSHSSVPWAPMWIRAWSLCARSQR